MSPESPLDATGIARRQFSTVRKGYDPGEVRAFLNELSEVVGRLQREEAHEHERAERAENRAELAENLDEHRLVELLGEETARVLEAARDAAAGIRSKAEEAAARMVREAQAEARSLTEHAERDATARRAELMGEVEGLRREATDELDRRRVEGQILVDDMRRAAEAERDQMVAEGERSRAEAAASAEQIRAAAREQGRRLVGEAQAVRERILGDLARRRRTAREQLERLNGARERLLAAYEVVRRTVDDATTELTVSLPEARMASAAAVQRVRDEPEESVDVLEAELSVARMSGTIDAAAATVSDDELDAMLRELAEEEAAQAAARREAEAGMALGEAEPAADDPETSADGPEPSADGPAPSAGEAGPAAAPSPTEAGALDDAGGLGDAGELGDAGAPAGGQPAGSPASGPVGGPASPLPPSPSADRPQTDAERWGVRLPSSSRRSRRAARPAPAPSLAPTAAATADPATARAGTATVDGPVRAGTVPAPAPSSAPAETVAPEHPAPTDTAPTNTAPAETAPAETAPAETAPPDTAAADTATPDTAPADAGETGPYVDELFARIRAERGGEAPRADAHDGRSVVASEPAPTSGTAPAGPAVDEATTTPTADDERAPDGSADAEEVDAVAHALRARDEALAPLERDLGRRLKRILADEQNEVLDTLRRGGTVEFADVLPAGDEHVDRYAIAAGAGLEAAAGHGAAAAGGERSTSCDALAGELGRALVQPLRIRVERSLDEAEGDVEEVTARLRALYREWKGQRIGAAVRHYAAAAYSTGLSDAVPRGAAQRWIVDPSSCSACPDCDDNALAGDVAGGHPFPTGDTRAPAHPDCRCLVVAAATLGTG